MAWIILNLKSKYTFNSQVRRKNKVFCMQHNSVLHKFYLLLNDILCFPELHSTYTFWLLFSKKTKWIFFLKFLQILMSNTEIHLWNYVCLCFENQLEYSNLRLKKLISLLKTAKNVTCQWDTCSQKCECCCDLPANHKVPKTNQS